MHELYIKNIMKIRNYHCKFKNYNRESNIIMKKLKERVRKYTTYLSAHSSISFYK